MSGLEIILVLALIAYTIYQQLVGQHLQFRRVVVLPAVVTIMGVTALFGSGQHLQPADIVCLAIGAAGSLVVGLTFGWIMRLESRNGVLWAQMPVRGLWLWVALVGWRLLDMLLAGALHAHVAASGTTLLLTLGINRLAQAAVLMLRSSRTGIPFAQGGGGLLGGGLGSRFGGAMGGQGNGAGYGQNGYNQAGYNQNSYNQNSYNQAGYNRGGLLGGGLLGRRRSQGGGLIGRHLRNTGPTGNGQSYGPNGYAPNGNAYPPNGYPPNGFPPNGNGNPPNGNGYPPNGYPPNRYRRNRRRSSYGPNGYGPSGYVPSGTGPNGYSQNPVPDGYGPDGNGLE